jgi:uncharacterized protein (TIGR03000 family)
VRHLVLNIEEPPVRLVGCLADGSSSSRLEIGNMYSVALLVTVSMAVDAPDCGRRGRCRSARACFTPCPVWYGWCPPVGADPPAVSSTMPQADEPTSPGETPMPEVPFKVYPQTEEDKRMLKELLELVPKAEDRKKLEEYWNSPGVDSKARKEYYEDLKKKAKEEGTSSPGTAGAAQIIVYVPADARLRFDGYAVKTPSARRVFETPVLETGHVFEYKVEAEVMRDGRPVILTQKVEVRAGRVTQVIFTEPTTTGLARK